MLRRMDGAKGIILIIMYKMLTWPLSVLFYFLLFHAFVKLIKLLVFLLGAGVVLYASSGVLCINIPIPKTKHESEISKLSVR